MAETKALEAPAKVEVLTPESVAMAKIQNERALEEHSDPFSSAAAYRFFTGIAELFSKSSFVPKHFQGAPGDCLIALSLAQTMGEAPLMLMQNTFMVSGTPGFKTQFMIARANRLAGFRSSIRWEVRQLDPPTTKASGFEMPNLEVRAYALDRFGEPIDATVTTAMAIAEGWTKNPKYRTMPKHMLMWRAAAFLIRLFSPEVMMGFQTAEEVEDLVASGQMKPEPTRAEVPRLAEFSPDPQSPEGQAEAEAKLDSVREPGDDEPPEAPKQAPEGKFLDAATAKALEEAAGAKQIPPKALETFLMESWGVDKLAAVPAAHGRKVADWIGSWKAPK